MREKSYIAFILGYDLKNIMMFEKLPYECDLAFDRCCEIADDFLTSPYNVEDKSLYECLYTYVLYKC